MVYQEDCTYQNFIGPLDAKSRKIWATCLFADPIADLAVLCSPDNQTLYKQAKAYETFTEAVTPLPVAVVDREMRAWLLALDGSTWNPCTVRRTQRALFVDGAVAGIYAGMSGSPIVNDAGQAVGIVSGSGGRPEEVEVHTEGANPHLASSLPGWLLDELMLNSRSNR
jgi:hypothetical protein